MDKILLNVSINKGIIKWLYHLFLSYVNSYKIIFKRK